MPDAVNVTYTIETLNGTYGQQEGIVLGENFLNKEALREVFTEIINDSNDKSSAIKEQIQKVDKVIKYLENDSNKPIGEVVVNIAEIQDFFQKELFRTKKQYKGDLGGDISLLTMFDVGKVKKMEIYHLLNEKELPSHLSDTAIQQQRYHNTNKELEQLKGQADKLAILDKTLKSHFLQFQTQLQEEQPPEIKREWHKWAGLYDDELNYELDSHDKRHFTTLAVMFWRKKADNVGYPAEAFGTHLALSHSQNLLNSIELIGNNSVIEELGGYTSHSLLSLLKSVKGNTMSQLGGDIIVIGPKGEVQFNIQSKASTKGAYSFTITYKKMINNLRLYLDIYSRSKDKKQISEKDLTALFNAFKAQAWVPIKNSLNQGIESVADDLTNLT